MLYTCKDCTCQFHLPILADGDILANCPDCKSIRIMLATINKPAEHYIKRPPTETQLSNCA